MGLTSGSPGDFGLGKDSFLEGWTQYAAVQLDRGGGIPALGGVNPVRALGMERERRRNRGKTGEAEPQYADPTSRSGSRLYGAGAQWARGTAEQKKEAKLDREHAVGSQLGGRQ